MSDNTQPVRNQTLLGDTYSMIPTNHTVEDPTVNKMLDVGVGFDVGMNMAKGVGDVIMRGLMFDFQQKAFNRQMRLLERELSLKETMWSDKMRLTEKAMDMQERLAEITADMKKAELKSNERLQIALADKKLKAKEALYNAQARRNLFMQSRYYGTPYRAA